MRIPRSNFSPVTAFEHSDHGNSEKPAVSHAEEVAISHTLGTETAANQVAGIRSMPAGDTVPAHIPLRSKQMNHNLAVKHWMDQDRTVKPEPVADHSSALLPESAVADNAVTANSAESGAPQTVQPAVGESVASAPKPANPSMVMTTAQHIAYQGLSVREQFGSGQPVWKNAFALAENVRFTRTPENELLKLRAKLIEEFGAQDEMELSSLSDQAEIVTVATQSEQAAEPVMVQEEITPVTQSASVQTSLSNDVVLQPAPVSTVSEVEVPVSVVLDVEPVAALVQEIDQQPEPAVTVLPELSSEPQLSAVSPLGFLSDFAFWEFADLQQAMPVISQDAEISASLSSQIVEPEVVAKVMQHDEEIGVTTFVTEPEPEMLANADEAVANGEGTAETLLDSILAMFRVVECHSTHEQGSEVAEAGSTEPLQAAEVEAEIVLTEPSLVIEEAEQLEIAEAITATEDTQEMTIEADESVSVLGSVSGFLPLSFSLSSYQLQTNFTAYGAQVETVAASSLPESNIEDLAELPVEHRDENVVTTPEQVAPVAATAEAEIAPLANAAVISARSPVNTVNLSIFSPTASENATIISSQDYQYPSHHLLQEPVYCEGAVISQEMLQRSAGLLENILEDFGVRGEIIHVRPGPVVTLYEFEPAPGVKSSRVIGLADDIARSMSALSARVAVVPGRNVIGIELPNAIRETVYLRELIESPAFERTNCRLPLCLGKTIGGEPVIAELAKMPHLLVAGTTGSGKSVAINTMILSLLYRLKPEECRLIMIDPKMLELSIYDGIPHLLTPVVTDPKKAVVALKWTVREMEERYRKMSRLGVRNIDGYNARAASAREKGETVTCTVQAGFDKTTGEILYEEQEMDLTPMPYIVIIVDEMADLMMVAGKEIEGAIQRLAQMARAAGIHLIMATQRPSVDVITGTIKANFPTRISFQVTSKIDSRTILGEQGAESLLGQGDMLHMAGGGRIVRVHGPFVSDEEVEKVVTHLKEQGRPDYLSTVTADEDDIEAAEDDSTVFDKSDLASEDGDDLYDKAVKIVLRDKKCSTSYIQRRLSIGYNRAASLVERMEQSGLVGAANHVGKREIIGSSE